MKIFKKGPQENMINFIVHFPKLSHEISIKRRKTTRYVLFDLLFLNIRHLDIIVYLAFVL